MDSSRPVVIITGAARRVGAVVAETLCEAGYDLAVSYRHSRGDAEALAARCEAKRAQSCLLLPLDLSDMAGLAPFIERVVTHYGRIDALINNASSFYPTAIGATTSADWDELFSTNAKAPFFLAQAAAPHLAKTRGCILNFVDIYGQRPLSQHPVYSMAKAALAMMTMALAKDLGPAVRVNGIAPGAVLWPEVGKATGERRELIARTPSARAGEPADIARTALFLLRDAPYITGEIIRVDGGRALSI
ncbi:MAG: pteridine reductase [Rhodanobacteraceae bacterium]|nr:pteridine reductase [Rhodanobacteraceae bacterium]